MGSVATGYGKGWEALCRDIEAMSQQGPSLLCHDREFSIATENFRRSFTTENFLSRQERPFGVTIQTSDVVTRSGWLGGVMTERAPSVHDSTSDKARQSAVAHTTMSDYAQCARQCM